MLIVMTALLLFHTACQDAIEGSESTCCKYRKILYIIKLRNTLPLHYIIDEALRTTDNGKQPLIYDGNNGNKENDDEKNNSSDTLTTPQSFIL